MRKNENSYIKKALAQINRNTQKRRLSQQNCWDLGQPGKSIINALISISQQTPVTPTPLFKWANSLTAPPSFEKSKKKKKKKNSATPALCPSIKYLLYHEEGATINGLNWHNKDPKYIYYRQQDCMPENIKIHITTDKSMYAILQTSFHRLHLT